MDAPRRVLDLEAPPSADADDGALASAAIAGDPRAIAAFWERHRRWVAAVILAHKPALDDLEDLLQDVARTFVEKAGTVRDPAGLRGWLRAVAVNAARASGRSVRLRPRSGWEETGAPPPRPDERFGAEDVRDELMEETLRRLQTLPDLYREPLLLRVVKGLTSRQVADILGVTPATVDTRVARARRMLLGAVREAGFDDDGGGAPRRFATARGDARPRPAAGGDS